MKSKKPVILTVVATDSLGYLIYLLIDTTLQSIYGVIYAVKTLTRTAFSAHYSSGSLKSVLFVNNVR